MPKLMWRTVVIGTSCAVAGAVLVQGGCGQQSESAPAAATPNAPASPAGERPRGADSAEARELVGKSREFYQQAERLASDVTFTIEAEGDTSATTMKFAAERPNRIVLDLSDGGTREYLLISDGQTLQQYLGEPLNMYSTQPAPEDFAQTMEAAKLGHEDGAGPMMHVMAPYMLGLGLLNGNALRELVEASDRVAYIGRESIDGVPHQHVRLESDALHIEMWLAEGEHPWITRIVPDVSPAVEEIRAMLGDEAADEMMRELPKITISMNWSIPAELPAEAFAFEAPENAEAVESLSEAMQNRFAAPRSELEGEVAPPLDLDLLGGGRINLEDHKGQVVILDFWATWCGPCVQALPILTSVAERYRDQGLVFYAVNVQEDPKVVQAFLDRHELDIKVPMDVLAEASRRYGVRGIPQTVLIGKDGSVQAVHVGLLPNLEEQLSREVEALLEGQSLSGGD